MNLLHRLLILLVLAFGLMVPLQSAAQANASRLNDLEQRLARVENRSSGDEAAGVAVFVCAAFCALWAQQTARNAWLWFFLGLVFNVITLLALLYKNANDRKTKA